MRVSNKTIDCSKRAESEEFMKLWYNDNGNKILVNEIITNHSMSIDDALENVDMDAFADEQGWDGWDYEALEMEW